ncbi:hypothetical protein QBC35DRAFT_496533 [Podospora australis]|uniref:Myb-like domain-containing protein n=1 Tax=Podospora australis TaxID=1536484 RepID=A0AAN7AJJ5_9PEZI|nr:hypothetical protein QBC35DRAFT_496533 [Podospora australis]
MLLPSALACDSSQTPPLTRLQSARFASPPASPPQLSTQAAVGNIFSTCRSLQSLLTNQAPPSLSPPAAIEPITPPTSFHAQLPTPPLTHAPSPLKLRLRSRKVDNNAYDNTKAPARKRIVKRAPAQPARGPNKRRRSLEDESGRAEDEGSDAEDVGQENIPEEEQERMEETPQTPKRARIAPEVIPLGLERTDYHSLHHQFADQQNEGQPRKGTDVIVETDGELWSSEEDRILVELVLEKLKLSKSEWQDCARSLGKDRNSLSRRWKSLMINGDVGLKRQSHRRAKLHGTWR